jgi:hypothetical protein
VHDFFSFLSLISFLAFLVFLVCNAAHGRVPGPTPPKGPILRLSTKGVLDFIGIRPYSRVHRALGLRAYMSTASRHIPVAAEEKVHQ